MTITLKLAVLLTLTLGCLVLAASRPVTLDGVEPPHAADICGKKIPESSVTQPELIILAKDSKDPDYGELLPTAAFDHAKHHDARHALDRKTPTECVECHHTEQRAAPGKSYLKTFKRSATLTADELASSKVPVKSCRTCHFQKATQRTAEFPPASVTYPPDVAKLLGMLESGELTNERAYHIRCTKCHARAKERDASVKGPTSKACVVCHVDRSATPTPTPSPCPSPSASPSPSP